MALAHGTRTAPAWVLTLQAAKEWGTPPWELTGGRRITWWLRYCVMSRLQADVAAEQARKARLKRG
ncbi:hypothetical protein D6833_04115 [Candidatus Parcubacteria bacterium]|nr:MAG: hypothetical protein D6833_04115 [Candidatus Parcubacteria bacterium]